LENPCSPGSLRYLPFPCKIFSQGCSTLSDRRHRPSRKQKLE
jgi:hypothetical protein